MIDKALFEIPRVRPVLALIVVLGVLQAALIVGQAHFLATVIVSLCEGEVLKAFHSAPLGAFLGCFVGLQVVIALQDEMLDRFACKTANDLQSQLLEIAFSDASVDVREMGSAGLTATALDGVNQVEQYLRTVLPKIIDMIVLPILILVAVFAVDWVSGIILLVMFPVAILFMVLIGKSAARQAAKQYATYQAHSNRFIDTLRGITTVKALGAGTRSTQDIYESSEVFRKATLKTIGYATLSSGVLDLVTTFGIAAVAMMLGFRLLDGSIVLFTGLFALFLAPEYFKPIRAFASDFHASQDGKNALAAINGAIASAATRAPIGTRALPQWTDTSTLRMEHVSFSYAYATTPSIDDASLLLTGCARVAIVGPSGAGKSTLASLLAGFAQPDTGAVAVDGVVLDSLRERAWRDQVLYIPQAPYIYHTTLRANLAFYAPDADDAALNRAIDAVGLRALVAELPEGLDTVIGQGGRALSGGQAQRIAFARAMLDDARRIIILDEPTAHLDIQTELELKDMVLELFTDRLLLIATHRLHWLANVDQVLVIENGRIVDHGSPDELRASSAALARLACANQTNRGGDAA